MVASSKWNLVFTCIRQTRLERCRCKLMFWQHFLLTIKVEFNLDNLTVLFLRFKNKAALGASDSLCGLLEAGEKISTMVLIKICTMNF